jgi:hypothetical protein
MDDTELQTCLDVIEAKKPYGDWDNKPAVPATTVAAQNTTDFPMWVEVAVNGATITAVKVDTVTIGARTSGMFRVRPGSSISITYSAGSPTWQWFYE